MIINNKSYFALGGLAIIAQRNDPVSLHEIGRYFNISVSYLEQIFNKLKTAGVVHGVRGPRGGYVLARAAEEITVPQILGALAPSRGGDPDMMDRHELMMKGLQVNIAETLGNLTLHELSRNVVRSPTMN